MTNNQQRIETLNGNFLCRAEDGELTYRNAVGEHIRYETSPDMWDVAVETWDRPVEMGRWVENKTDPQTFSWYPLNAALQTFDSRWLARNGIEAPQSGVIYAPELLVAASVRHPDEAFLLVGEEDEFGSAILCLPISFLADRDPHWGWETASCHITRTGVGFRTGGDVVKAGTLALLPHHRVKRVELKNEWNYMDIFREVARMPRKWYPAPPSMYVAEL